MNGGEKQMSIKTKKVDTYINFTIMGKDLR